MSRPLAALLAGAALLSACAIPAKRPLPADTEAAWSARRTALERIGAWRLSGTLGVRSEGNGGQARVEWRQESARYEIRLSGPLGSGMARLVGDERGATLSLASGETVGAADPALLLYRQLGWWVPVPALRYWAVGLPAPDTPAVWSLDEYGRLASLEQGGWMIRFSDYQRLPGAELPGRLEVTGHNAEVRLVVRQWELTGSAGIGQRGLSDVAG